jgi:hypothetical protein
MTRRTRLSAGSPPGCGIIAFPVVVFPVVVEAFVAFLAVDQLRRFFTGGDFGPLNWLAFVVLYTFIAIILYAVGVMILVYLRLARHRCGSRARSSSNEASCCAGGSTCAAPEWSCRPIPRRLSWR